MSDQQSQVSVFCISELLEEILILTTLKDPRTFLRFSRTNKRIYEQSRTDIIQSYFLLGMFGSYLLLPYASIYYPRQMSKDLTRRLVNMSTLPNYMLTLLVVGDIFDCLVLQKELSGAFEDTVSLYELFLANNRFRSFTNMRFVPIPGITYIDQQGIEISFIMMLFNTVMFCNDVMIEATLAGYRLFGVTFRDLFDEMVDITSDFIKRNIPVYEMTMPRHIIQFDKAITRALANIIDLNIIDIDLQGVIDIFQSLSYENESEHLMRLLFDNSIRLKEILDAKFDSITMPISDSDFNLYERIIQSLTNSDYISRLIRCYSVDFTCEDPMDIQYRRIPYIIANSIMIENMSDDVQHIVFDNVLLTTIITGRASIILNSNRNLFRFVNDRQRTWIVNMKNSLTKFCLSDMVRGFIVKKKNDDGVGGIIIPRKKRM